MHSKIHRKENEKEEVTEYEFFVCFGMNSKYIPKVLILQAILYWLFHSTTFLIKKK